MKNIFGRLTRRLKALFAKIRKNAADEKSPGAELPQPETDGANFKLWAWLLPVILGVTAGWLGMTCLEVWLDGRNARSRPFAAETSSSAQEPDEDDMMVFLRTNPFNVTPMPYAGPEETETGAPPVTGSLASAVLIGTSPGYIAWMEDQGKLKLVMLGGSFDVYTLEEVTYLDATFVNGGNRVVKEIVYGGGTGPGPQQPSPNVAAPSFAGQVAPPASGGGAPGVINRDVINHLLENPFDELKKVRIRPVTDGQGLRVEWIVPESILSQLGVRENDVVQAINGIVFRNAMDVSNSLNSLIASDQFVVDVVRDGQPTTLAYEVR